METGASWVHAFIIIHIFTCFSFEDNIFDLPILFFYENAIFILIDLGNILVIF